MQKDDLQMGIGVGSTSILVIFVVLCLTTFATLSLVSANADYRLTLQTADAIRGYYQGDSKAESTRHAIGEVIRQNPPAAWEGLLEVMEVSVTQEGDATVFSYEVAIHSSKSLRVRLAEDLTPLEWRVVTTEEIDPDNLPIEKLLGEGNP